MRMKIMAAGQTADQKRGSVVLLGNVHDVRDLQRLLGQEVEVEIKPVRDNGLQDR